MTVPTNLSSLQVFIVLLSLQQALITGCITYHGLSILKGKKYFEKYFSVQLQHVAGNEGLLHQEVPVLQQLTRSKWDFYVSCTTAGCILVKNENASISKGTSAKSHHTLKNKKPTQQKYTRGLKKTSDGITNSHTFISYNTFPHPHRKDA